jgi:hypothetical protein
MTRVEQFQVVPKSDGAVLYALRDDGKLYRLFDRFGERRGEWVQMPRVPGVGVLEDMDIKGVEQ